jgi:hypothetical protein
VVASTISCCYKTASLAWYCALKVRLCSFGSSEIFIDCIIWPKVKIRFLSCRTEMHARVTQSKLIIFANTNEDKRNCAWLRSHNLAESQDSFLILHGSPNLIIFASTNEDSSKTLLLLGIVQYDYFMSSQTQRGRTLHPRRPSPEGPFSSSVKVTLDFCP